VHEESSAVSQWRFITYDELDDAAIVRVMLNRPERRNAQNRGLLVELDEAMTQAEQDDRVRVVILGGSGPAFSSGHDLGSPESVAEMTPGPSEHLTQTLNGATKPGAEGRMRQEWHYFFQNTLRWRNLRKITIAEVHGPVIAAGLMLAWCCDLIVAADDTSFRDVVGARLGMCGLEYFAHPWEFGPRKAKELLLTGDAIDAAEAERLGMLTQVVPRSELAETTMQLAQRIAALPSVTSLLIKESVNQAVDQMGFFNSLQSAFSLHQLNHAHWAEVNEDGFPVARLG
jgi:enoyl-CoA hydratase